MRCVTEVLEESFGRPTLLITGKKEALVELSPPGFFKFQARMAKAAMGTAFSEREVRELAASTAPEESIAERAQDLSLFRDMPQPDTAPEAVEHFVPERPLSPETVETVRLG